MRSGVTAQLTRQRKTHAQRRCGHSGRRSDYCGRCHRGGIHRRGVRRPTDRLSDRRAHCDGYTPRHAHLNAHRRHARTKQSSPRQGGECGLLARRPSRDHLEPGGINFDLKPPTTSADSPTNISFDGNTIENYYVGTTMLVSQWAGQGRATRAQCVNQVLTNPTHSVSNVAEGMQICLRTAQGRIGRLTVTSISPDLSTLDVTAVIWN